MFGLSIAEVILVLLIAVIFIRPSDWPEIAHFVGKMLFRGKKMLATVKSSFAELEKDSVIGEIKSELSRGMASEKTKEDDSSIIIDIYGNEHVVSDLSQLRSDLNKAQITSEIELANKSNLEVNRQKSISGKANQS